MTTNDNLQDLLKEGYTHAIHFSGLEEGFAGYAKSYAEAVRIANRLNDLGNDSCYMPMYEAPYVEGSETWGLPDTGGHSYIIMSIDKGI